MKRFYILLFTMCVCVFMFSMCAPVLAATEVPYFCYDGRGKEFTLENTENNNLFQNFDSVMPGDMISQGFVVEGKHIKDNAKLYLKVDKDFRLPEGVKLMVYDGSELLYDSTDNQTGKILLHNFEKSESVEFLIVLDIYAGVDNTIADTQSNVKWAFVIEDSGKEYSPEVPKTGESGLLVVSIIVFVLSVAGVIFVVFVLEKRKNDEKNKEN